MLDHNPIPTDEELKDQAEADKAELDKLAAEDQAKKDDDGEAAKKASKEVDKNNAKDDEDDDSSSDEGDDDSSKEGDDDSSKEGDDDSSKDDSKHRKIPKEENDADLKKKFSESSKSAQILHSKVRAFEKASEVSDPTDEDMKVEYSDWDDLNEFEQKTAKFNWKQVRRNEAQDKVVAESKDVDKWNQKVDEFIDDPQNLIDEPELEGKLASFKIFAERESSLGVSFDILVGAFLRDVDKDKPAKKKGKMFEKGSGGPSKKSKVKKKLTLEEGAKLRDVDGEEFKRQLMAGNIDEF